MPVTTGVPSPKFHDILRGSPSGSTEADASKLTVMGAVPVVADIVKLPDGGKFNVTVLSGAATAYKVYLI